MRDAYFKSKTGVARRKHHRLAAACDLHQARNPNPNAGIDAVGWLVSALVAAIVAVAAVIAYEANDTRPNAPVSQIVAR
jgi:hypothetical protein